MNCVTPWVSSCAMTSIAFGKALENLPVAVAVDHLLTIPKGVVIALAIMDRGNERLACVIDRFAIEDVLVEFPARAGVVERLIDRKVDGRRILLGEFEIAGDVFGVAAVEDLPAQPRSGQSGRRRRAGVKLRPERRKRVGHPYRSGALAARSGSPLADSRLRMLGGMMKQQPQTFFILISPIAILPMQSISLKPERHCARNRSAPVLICQPTERRSMTVYFSGTSESSDQAWERLPERPRHAGNSAVKPKHHVETRPVPAGW